MGSGKTTAGKALSKKLSLPFFDLDELIQKKTGLSISDYFKSFGEEKFREAEQKALHETFFMDGAVIATGGGTPCFHDNIEEINKNGLSIYLQANAKLLCSRLKEKKEKRPLISNLSDEELLNHLEALLVKREKFYSKAHFTVSAVAPIEKILEIFNFKANQDF
jgi:shikimate kinase